jgi:hypothetical protein
VPRKRFLKTLHIFPFDFCTEGVINVSVPGVLPSPFCQLVVAYVVR